MRFPKLKNQFVILVMESFTFPVKTRKGRVISQRGTLFTLSLELNLKRENTFDQNVNY